MIYSTHVIMIKKKMKKLIFTHSSKQMINRALNLCIIINRKPIVRQNSSLQILQHSVKYCQKQKKTSLFIVLSFKNFIAKEVCPGWDTLHMWLEHIGSLGMWIWQTNRWGTWTSSLLTMVALNATPKHQLHEHLKLNYRFDM